MTDAEVIEIVESNFSFAEDCRDCEEYNDPFFPEWDSFASYLNNAMDTIKEKKGTSEQLELALCEFMRLKNRK